MDTITLLKPEGLVASPVFSHVAVIPPTATTVLLGGQNGVGPDGTVVSADVAEQTTQAMQNARTALAAAGATFDDVVAWTVLLVDGVDVQAAFGAAAAELGVRESPPLVTMAHVAGLGVPGALVEVAATAALA